jgi:hypothetical protein
MGRFFDDEHKITPYKTHVRSFPMSSFLKKACLEVVRYQFF